MACTWIYQSHDGRIGTSSGLGRSLVKVALSQGDKVVATARKLETIQDFLEECVPILSSRHHSAQVLSYRVAQRPQIVYTL